MFSRLYVSLTDNYVTVKYKTRRGIAKSTCKIHFFTLTTLAKIFHKGIKSNTTTLRSHSLSRAPQNSQKPRKALISVDLLKTMANRGTEKSLFTLWNWKSLWCSDDICCGGMVFWVCRFSLRLELPRTILFTEQLCYICASAKSKYRKLWQNFQTKKGLTSSYSGRYLVTASLFITSKKVTQYPKNQPNHAML